MSTTPLADITTETAPNLLTWVGPSGDPLNASLPPGPTTVGAGPRCSIRLQGRGVRPLHCVIHRSDEGVSVRRWSAGTEFNGRSFSQANATVGNRLTIAGIDLQFESDRGAGDPGNGALENSIGESTSTAASPVADSFEEVAPQRQQPLPTLEAAVPAHLLQPWLEAQPKVATPESESPSSSRDVAEALHTTRRRARSLVEALRSARRQVAQFNDGLCAAGKNRDDLAIKLMFAQTELHDLRGEVQLVEQQRDAALTASDDYQRLFDEAKRTVDELEATLAAARAETQTFAAERDTWVGQREQLEQAIVALEQRIDQPAVEPLGVEDSVGMPVPVEPADPMPVADLSDGASQLIPVNEFDAPAESLWDAEQQPAATDATPSAPAVEAAVDVTVEPATEPQDETSIEPPADAGLDTQDGWGGDWLAGDVATDTPVDTTADVDEQQAAEAWLAAFQTDESAQTSEAASTPESDTSLADPLPVADAAQDPEDFAEDFEESTADSLLDAEPIKDEPTNDEQLPHEEPIGEAPGFEESGVDAELSFAAATDDDAVVSEPIAVEEAADGELDEALLVDKTAEQPVEEPIDNETAAGEAGDSRDEATSGASLLEQAGILSPGGLGAALDDRLNTDPLNIDQPSEDHSADEPIAAEGLIASEQPTSDAPVSFIEQYADLLPQDDEPAPVEAPTLAALAPVMPEPASVSVSANEPAGEGDESIEDYMAKLMQRMRGEEASEVVAASAVEMNANAAASAAAMHEPAAEELTAPLTDLKELRSGPAPEQATDMTSLRALANQTARNAIGVSEVKSNREQAALNLTISILAMGCAVFLAITAPSWLDWTVFAGVAGFGWGAYWFYGTLTLMLEARAKESKAKVASNDEPTSPVENLPIAPEQG